jgi:hypothetical protein
MRTTRSESSTSPLFADTACRTLKLSNADMSLKTLQLTVAPLCVMAIAGMIVMSIKDNIGGAMTFGIVGALAISALMIGNAVLSGSNTGGAQDALGIELEARVQELVAKGTDEAALRSVVKKAVRLGRGDR